jgi:phage virion morphogenesis protein
MSETIEGMERLDHTLDGLAAALSPAGRRKLGLKIGQQIRRANVARIGKNVAPDGTPFTPRLRQKSKKKLKNRMFTKLKATQHMRLTRTPDEITLSFKGRSGRIAEVHHFGLRDRVNKTTTHKYAARPLLGFSQSDLDAIEDLLLAHVAEGIR